MEFRLFFIIFLTLCFTSVNSSIIYSPNMENNYMVSGVEMTREDMIANEMMNDDDETAHAPVVKLPGLTYYMGVYSGHCEGDGLYYKDRDSFVMCSNDYMHEQRCPIGAINSGADKYQNGEAYSFHEFCDVNTIGDDVAAELPMDPVPTVEPSTILIKKPKTVEILSPLKTKMAVKKMENVVAQKESSISHTMSSSTKMDYMTQNTGIMTSQKKNKFEDSVYSVENSDNDDEIETGDYRVMDTQAVNSNLGNMKETAYTLDMQETGFVRPTQMHQVAPRMARRRRMMPYSMGPFPGLRYYNPYPVYPRYRMHPRYML